MKTTAILLTLLMLVGCGGNKLPTQPMNYTASGSVAYETDPACVATIFRPLGNTSNALPWILGIHGGGFEGGSRMDLTTYANEFCPEGYAVVAIDYRLTSSGVTWPRPLLDCQAALRFFRTNAASLGLDPEHFVVMGGSAGGCLATHLGLEDDPVSPLGHAAHVVDNAGEQDLRLRENCFSNFDGFTSRLLGHAGPWTDEELLGPSNIQRARADTDFFVIHGTQNTDVYVANSDALVSALQTAGAPVEYHRVEGGNMWALADPTTDAALHVWLAARLR